MIKEYLAVKLVNKDSQIGLSLSCGDYFAIKDQNTIFSEADFLRAYHDTDFVRSLPTAKLVEKLESQPAEDVAQYMQNLLDSIGSTHMNERGRLLYLANELHTPALLSFWTNVLERKPKGLENEATLLDAKEPGVDLLELRNEIYSSLRNLAVFSYKDESALDALTRYAKAPDPNFNNTLFRKEAYYRIREVNATAAARTISELSKSDPLRAAPSHD
ncbi:MAG: hypothetical protein H7249_13950 [Chitinophagaceae bacterium]|nr:hypothetical protein [Oligoflexus sp.]